MTIDSATVSKIAHLSRIKVPEEEQKQMAGELDQILKWVAQLDEVKTDNVEPLASVHDTSLRMREDVINDGGKQADILANAPAKTADFFTVPKVIE